jgi:hypothetical protein
MTGSGKEMCGDERVWQIRAEISEEKWGRRGRGGLTDGRRKKKDRKGKT